MYILYILKSLKNNSFYIGTTNNFSRRIKEHNNGKSKYTKSKTPFIPVYHEFYSTLSEARKREKYLKSLKKRSYIENLIKNLGKKIEDPR